jgi:molybdenum cofactor synthesis domain-containing protein
LKGGISQLTEFDLLRKTELKIKGITLKNANLGDIASAVGDTLKIERKDLLVTDVQGDHLVIDILKKGLDPHHLIGKEDELLKSLSKISGVEMTEEASVVSEGMLSWITSEPGEAKIALEHSEKMAREIQERLSRIAIVFSTGSEVAGHQIMDTNTPAIRCRLQSEGYSVKSGPTLKDDDVLIAAHLRQAVDDGYGLAIITGGVGAEDKDQTIEAVLRVDPEAATPHVMKYQLGVGRHQHKDSVRIAVGKISQTLIVALPGPNDEVQLGLEALVKGLASHLSKDQLAKDIADSLKAKLKEKIHS